MKIAKTKKTKKIVKKSVKISVEKMGTVGKRICSGQCGNVTVLHGRIFSVIELRGKSAYNRMHQG